MVGPVKPLLESSFLHHGHGWIVPYVPPCMSCNNRCFPKDKEWAWRYSKKVLSWALHSLFISWFQTTTATGKSCCRHSSLGWTEFELTHAVTRGRTCLWEAKEKEGFPLYLWDHLHALPSHKLLTASKVTYCQRFPLMFLYIHEFTFLQLWLWEEPGQCLVFSSPSLRQHWGCCWGDGTPCGTLVTKELLKNNLWNPPLTSCSDLSNWLCKYMDSIKKTDHLLHPPKHPTWGVR